MGRETIDTLDSEGQPVTLVVIRQEIRESTFDGDVVIPGRSAVFTEAGERVNVLGPDEFEVVATGRKLRRR